MIFEQGALDSLWNAKRALERAIENYDRCRSLNELSEEAGPLFATLDNLDTAKREINDAINIATTE